MSSMLPERQDFGGFDGLGISRNVKVEGRGEVQDKVLACPWYTYGYLQCIQHSDYIEDAS